MALHQLLIICNEMFHEVRIKNEDGSVRKTIHPKKLNRLYWKHFKEGEDRIGLISTSQKPIPTWVKKNLDLLYPETFEINYY